MAQPRRLLMREIATRAVGDAFRKLDPRVLVLNPVVLVVVAGAVICSVDIVLSLANGQPAGFHLHLTLWLWFTALFANYAEAVAEGRGKAQAEFLRNSRASMFARRLEDGREERIPATMLRKGDVVICEAGDVIPADGTVTDGIATVDESAITGESAPVLRESGGDRSAVTGGTRILSDRIVVLVTSEPGSSFLDRMIALVEGARRRKTPNEIALTILLLALTAIFVLAVATLPAFVLYSRGWGSPGPDLLTIPVMTALLVCLIPTTIGGLLSAIGISGMDRLIRRNVIATSGRAVETAGDIVVLLLDKTGTITLGNRIATALHPAIGITEDRLARSAHLASLADDTPEGRSIIILAKDRYGIRGGELTHTVFVPFSAQTRMSGVDISDGRSVRSIRKGDASAIEEAVRRRNGSIPPDVRRTVDAIARRGATPLVVADDAAVLGVIELKDVIKGGLKERFAQLRAMGIRTVMITGDNPLTAAAIAAEAGVDDFIAGARPEDKLRRIREEQSRGHLVGMIGDGTNDAPALAQADVGIVMNTGTQAAREAGNMVDLDSNPTKLLEVVEVGKQLLMTRGALTTFSIANDVAKYFAILPAITGGLYAFGAAQGPLAGLNVMGLHSPEGAILSATIFNALVIVLLIPLALRGVTYRPVAAPALLRRNLLVYGLGGVVAPFVGIKLIDILLTALEHL